VNKKYDPNNHDEDIYFFQRSEPGAELVDSRSVSKFDRIALLSARINRLMEIYEEHLSLIETIAVIGRDNYNTRSIKAAPKYLRMAIHLTQVKIQLKHCE